MHVEPKIALDCPGCGESIYEPLSWFKQTYSTCPACENGLAAGQFGTVIAELEQAMDKNTEEMLYGQPQGGCCSKPPSSGESSSCCKGSSSNNGPSCR